MRIAIVGTLGLALSLLAGSAYGRSAPPGIDPNSKDPCKNGVKMLKDTCDQKCDKGPKKKAAACKADCSEQEKRFAIDCPKVIKGQKPKDEVKREDRAHERGLDKAGNNSSSQPLPKEIPSLDHSGVGG
jgi:hypothetical protein